jgi:hypothetical protein
LIAGGDRTPASPDPAPSAQFALVSTGKAREMGLGRPSGVNSEVPGVHVAETGPRVLDDC